jgi:hypothetical protein
MCKVVGDLEEEILIHSMRIPERYHFVLLCFALLGFELRDSWLLGIHSTMTHTSSPPSIGFYFFQVGSSIFVWGWSWTMRLLPMPPNGWDHSRQHYTWLVDWDVGLANFFPGLSSNCDPSNPCLLSIWDHSHEVLCLVQDNVLHSPAAAGAPTGLGCLSGK